MEVQVFHYVIRQPIICNHEERKGT